MAAAWFFLLASGETTQPWDLQAAEIDAGQSQKATGSLAPFFMPSVQYWEEDILQWAADWHLDPNLIATVMQIESCGDPRALSPAGAMGLFQVMPYHFTASDTPYDPDTNARRGMAYLDKALNTYDGNILLGLASYNGGIGTAAKSETYWPQETIRYVYWGTNIYKEATKGKQNSPTLEEWLSAGGTSLCNQANERLGISP